MKTVRFFFVLVSCFLLMRAMSDGEDQKSALADVDIHHHKWINNRTLRVPSPISGLILEPSQKGLRNHGLATVGGPANTLRSTPVINGTGMKRKP